MSYTDVATWVGAVVLPVLGFFGLLLINGLRATVKDLKEADMALSKRIDEIFKEIEQWRREIPERYASKSDLQDRFNLVLTRLDRMEDKLDQALHRSNP